MNDQMLYDRLARTDAYAPDQPVSDESWTPDVALAEIQRRITMQTDVRTTPTPSPRRPRGWLVAAAAFVGVIVAGIAIALATAGGDGEPADQPTTTTQAVTTTTVVETAVDASAVRSAIERYVTAVNAGDADGAIAPFALTDDDIDHPRASVPRNLTEFLVTVGWTFAVADDCATDALGVGPGEAAMGCALVVDSPVHRALGVEGGIRDDGIANHDQINLWHSPDAPVAVRWFLDSGVRIAYINWMTTNDPDGFAANCDPALDGNYTEQYAYYEGFIHTAQCAEYLNSITSEVVGSIQSTATPEQEATVLAAIDEYVMNVNAGDGAAALAAFDLTEDGITQFAAGPTRFQQEALAEFLVTLGWRMTPTTKCTIGVRPNEPDVAGATCLLAIDSPVHTALGVTPGDVVEDGLDAIDLWHSPSAPVIAFVRFDRAVATAYVDWAEANDPEGFADTCDPASPDGAGDPPLSDRVAYTRACAEYLVSITDDVVASIEAGG